MSLSSVRIFLYGKISLCLNRLGARISIYFILKNWESEFKWIIIVSHYLEVDLDDNETIIEIGVHLPRR